MQQFACSCLFILFPYRIWLNSYGTGIYDTGQSAVTAAAIALEDGVIVQDVDYQKLKERLLADKQVLSWKV